MSAKKDKHLIFVKAVGKLLPVDDIAEEALATIPYGEEVSIEIKRPHNLKLFKRYWALVNMVWQNQERYETREQVSNALKILAGEYEQLHLPGDIVAKIPKSIAFDKMDATEFSQFWKRVCDAIAKHFMPYIKNPDLEDEIAKLIGARY